MHQAPEPEPEPGAPEPGAPLGQCEKPPTPAPRKPRGKKEFLTFDEKQTVLQRMYRTIKSNYGAERDEAQDAALALEREVYASSTGRTQYEQNIRLALQRLENREVFEPVRSQLLKATVSQKTSAMDIESSLEH